MIRPYSRFMMVYLQWTVLVLANVRLAASDLVFDRFFATTGSKVNGSPTKVVITDTLYLCCQTCEETANCAAANYNKDAKSCELFSSKLNDESFSLSVSNGWNSFFKTMSDVNPMTTAYASQSSTFETHYAHLAIDGDTDWVNFGTCSNAVGAGVSWWMVEFQRVFTVSAVMIWNRMLDDCNDGHPCWDRARGFKLSVGNSQNAVSLGENVCGTYAGPPFNASDNPIRIDCDPLMYGKFMRITKDDPNLHPIALCEVQIIP